LWEAVAFCDRFSTSISAAERRKTKSSGRKVALDLLVEALSSDAVQSGELAVEKHPPSMQDADRLRDVLHCDRCALRLRHLHSIARRVLTVALRS